MKRLSLAILIAFSALSATAQPTTLTAVLTGTQEATPNTSPGFGTATVVVNSARNQLSVTVVFSRLSGPVTQAHIHRGEPGVAGPPVVDLVPSVNVSGNRISGTFAIAQALGDELATTPQNFYVNVHTAQFPAGEIRGQLATTGGLVSFAGELRGANEVPPVTTNATGAYFMSLDANNNLTYEINVAGLQNATLAHIHTGAAGATGPPIVTFASSAADFQNGRLRGTINISGLSADRLALFRTNPTALYVNVHTTANPGGELRAQLTPANEYLLPVAGKVTNAIGQTFVTDVRIFNPSYENTIEVLIEFFPTGRSSLTAEQSAVVRVRPRGTAVLDDVNAAMLQNVIGIGALRVSSSSRIVVTSRIYNDQRAAGKGTLGQFVASQTRASLLTRGALAQLSNRTVDLTSGSRTNLGFFNPNPVVATVRLEVRDELGTVVATNTLFLMPMSQQQASIDSYFPFTNFGNRPYLSVSFDSSVPISTYASVVDNVSGDQIFVVAQEDGGVPAQ